MVFFNNAFVFAQPLPDLKDRTKQALIPLIIPKGKGKGRLDGHAPSKDRGFPGRRPPGTLEPLTSRVPEELTHLAEEVANLEAASQDGGAPRAWVVCEAARLFREIAQVLPRRQHLLHKLLDQLEDVIFADHQMSEALTGSLERSWRIQQGILEPEEAPKSIRSTVCYSSATGSERPDLLASHAEEEEEDDEESPRQWPPTAPVDFADFVASELWVQKKRRKEASNAGPESDSEGETWADGDAGSCNSNSHSISDSHGDAASTGNQFPWLESSQEDQRLPAAAAVYLQRWCLDVLEDHEQKLRVHEGRLSRSPQGLPYVLLMAAGLWKELMLKWVLAYWRHWTRSEVLYVKQATMLLRAKPAKNFGKGLRRAWILWKLVYLENANNQKRNAWTERTTELEWMHGRFLDLKRTAREFGVDLQYGQANRLKQEKKLETAVGITEQLTTRINVMQPDLLQRLLSESLKALLDRALPFAGLGAIRTRLQFQHKDFSTLATEARERLEDISQLSMEMLLMRWVNYLVMDCKLVVTGLLETNGASDTRVWAQQDLVRNVKLCSIARNVPLLTKGLGRGMEDGTLIIILCAQLASCRKGRGVEIEDLVALDLPVEARVGAACMSLHKLAPTRAARSLLSAQDIRTGNSKALTLFFAALFLADPPGLDNPIDQDMIRSHQEVIDNVHRMLRDVAGVVAYDTLQDPSYLLDGDETLSDLMAIPFPTLLLRWVNLQLKVAPPLPAASFAASPTHAAAASSAQQQAANSASNAPAAQGRGGQVRSPVKRSPSGRRPSNGGSAKGLRITSKGSSGSLKGDASPDRKAPKSLKAAMAMAGKSEDPAPSSSSPAAPGSFGAQRAAAAVASAAGLAPRRLVIRNFGEDLSDGIVLFQLLRVIAPNVMQALQVSDEAMMSQEGRFKAILECCARLDLDTFIAQESIAEGVEEQLLGFVAALFHARPCLPLTEASPFYRHSKMVESVLEAAATALRMEEASGKGKDKDKRPVNERPFSGLLKLMEGSGDQLKEGWQQVQILKHRMKILMGRAHELLCRTQADRAAQNPVKLPRISIAGISAAGPSQAMQRASFLFQECLKNTAWATNMASEHVTVRGLSVRRVLRSRLRFLTLVYEQYGCPVGDNAYLFKLASIERLYKECGLFCPCMFMSPELAEVTFIQIVQESTPGVPQCQAGLDPLGFIRWISRLALARADKLSAILPEPLGVDQSLVDILDLHIQPMAMTRMEDQFDRLIQDPGVFRTFCGQEAALRAIFNRYSRQPPTEEAVKSMGPSASPRMDLSGFVAIFSDAGLSEEGSALSRPVLESIFQNVLERSVARAVGEKRCACELAVDLVTATRRYLRRSRANSLPPSSDAAKTFMSLEARQADLLDAQLSEDDDDDDGEEAAKKWLKSSFEFRDFSPMLLAAAMHHCPNLLVDIDVRVGKFVTDILLPGLRWGLAIQAVASPDDSKASSTAVVKEADRHSSNENDDEEKPDTNANSKEWNNSGNNNNSSHDSDDDNHNNNSSNNNNEHHRNGRRRRSSGSKAAVVHYLDKDQAEQLSNALGEMAEEASYEDPSQHQRWLNCLAYTATSQKCPIGQPLVRSNSGSQLLTKVPLPLRLRQVSSHGQRLLRRGEPIRMTDGLRRQLVSHLGAGGTDVDGSGSPSNNGKGMPTSPKRARMRRPSLRARSSGATASSGGRTSLSMPSSPGREGVLEGLFQESTKAGLLLAGLV